MIEVLALAGLVLLVADALLYGVFTARFGWRRGWSRYAEGRHLMRLSLALAATLAMTATFRLVEVPLLLALWIQAVLLLVIGAEGVARNLLLGRNGHERDESDA